MAAMACVVYHLSVSVCAVTADILSEFLEVAIHSVLYCRGVYPQGVFGRKKKYNVPVQVKLPLLYVE